MRGARFEEVLRNCQGGTPLELTPEELAEGWHYCPEVSGQLALQRVVGGQPWCGCGRGPSELDTLRSLLKRCRYFVEADVQMMADISRFAPFSAEDQAKHDSTEFPSEVLLRDIDALGLT